MKRFRPRKGSFLLGVGPMFLAMVVTIFDVPLSWLVPLPGVDVNVEQDR